MQQLDPKLVGILLPLLQSTPLIVIGYRGAEPSIMKSLLGEGGDLAFKKGIFWCHRGGDLHPNVEVLRLRLGSNFKLCEIDGFDELFADLDKKLARQQRTLGAPAAADSRDFDDRPMEGATIADLDLDSPYKLPTNTRRSSDYRAVCRDLEAFPSGTWSSGR